MNISIQGHPGSYHHLATKKMWPSENIKLMHRDTFDQVFDDIATDQAEGALIAIENTQIGSIGRTLDLLAAQPMLIVSEINLHIHHQLIGLPQAKLDSIRQVLSQVEALDQCRDFLHQQLIAPVPRLDTAASVQEMMDTQNTQIGSIASSLAAEIHGAKILAPNVESNPHNYTRFIVVTHPNKAAILIKKHNNNQPSRKTSLIVRISHQPGSLAQTLTLMSTHGLNLTKIESRPIIGEPWNYHIFIDLEHSIHQELAPVLELLEATTKQITILGTYAPGETHET